MVSVPPKVLLIEDNPGDIRLIREALAEVDEAMFHLEVAERLSVGLAYLAASQVDLVLLDLALPDSFGLETFFSVHTRAPGVPIVVLSMSEDDAMAVRAVQAGAQDYLVKGYVDRYSLLRSLRYAIERGRAEDALRRAKAELEMRVQERTAALAAANDALRAEIAERQRAEERQRFLAEVGAMLANSLDDEATLTSLVGLAVPFLADWCTVYSVSDAEPPRIMAMVHRDPAQAEGVRAITRCEPPDPSRPDPVLEALHSGRPVLLPEVPPGHRQTIAEDAQPAQLVPQLPAVSYMAVPLVARGRLVGVMSFGTAASGRRYGPADLTLAEEVACRCALAVDNARLYREARAEIGRRMQAEREAEQRRREAEVLARLAQTLSASLDLDTVLQRVAEGAWELCGSERALIMLREPGAEALVSRYQAGFPQMPYVELRIEPGKGMGGWVLATGRSLRTADYAADPRFSKDYLDRIRIAGRIAVLAVPITIGTRVEGVLYVSNHAAHPFMERDEAILLRLADYAATAIRNAQLYHAAQDELFRRTAAEAQLQASLQEKEVLLREIHHRVKNNLQIVSSLLNLQLRIVDDPHLQALLQDSRQRLQAMALIHETLYQAHDLSRVPFGMYVRRLAAQLLRAYDGAARRIRLNLEADPIALDIERATPCALIFHELLSNALTHAFPNGRSGTIDVALRRAGDQLTLAVRDSGVGVPQALEVRRPRSLGLKLISILTEQLDGTLVLEREGGTTFTLTLPSRRR
jgi:two-component sensor histidine kinase/DNA-binding NarL/FixJ family response regulator